MYANKLVRNGGIIMATFLVDYENVWHQRGLEGTEYLGENDSLYLFFSSSCEKIHAKYIKEIEKSKCAFEIVKLKVRRNNALDFYIAAECGKLVESGEMQIAIISKDKGLSSVVDYFKVREEASAVTVVTAASVEAGIVSLNSSGDSARRKSIHEKNTMMDLAVEHARISERNSFRKAILDSFKGTQYEERSAEILEYVEANRGKGGKRLYSGALHQFGRNSGLEIYRILKRVV